MRTAVLLPLLALAACSPSEPELEAPSSSAPPPPVIDTWTGKYSGDLMVRISGTPGAHKVVLVAASADGCTGDIGLAGGQLVKDIGANELRLEMTPADKPPPAGEKTPLDKAVCTIRIVREGDALTVSESGICTAWHGLSCTFDGKAVRVR